MVVLLAAIGGPLLSFVRLSAVRLHAGPPSRFFVPRVRIPDSIVLRFSSSLLGFVTCSPDCCLVLVHTNGAWQRGCVRLRSHATEFIRSRPAWLIISTETIPQRRVCTVQVQVVYGY